MMASQDEFENFWTGQNDWHDVRRKKKTNVSCKKTFVEASKPKKLVADRKKPVIVKARGSSGVREVKNMAEAQNEKMVVDWNVPCAAKLVFGVTLLLLGLIALKNAWMVECAAK